MSDWNDVYTARFGRTLAPKEVKAWDVEIQYSAQGATKEEISQALRNISEYRRQYGDGKEFPANCNDIISAVLALRKSRKEMNAAQSCPKCLNGWYQYREGRASIPCTCDAGKRESERAIESGTYRDIEQVQELQRSIIK